MNNLNRPHRTKGKITVNLSSESMEVRRYCSEIFEILTEKIYYFRILYPCASFNSTYTRILYPAKLSFNNEGGIMPH